MNSTLAAPPVTGFAAAQATTMKESSRTSTAHRTFSSSRRSTSRSRWTTRCSSRSTAAAVNMADWIALTGRPYAARLAHNTLVSERRWTTDEYARWLGRVLACALLTEPIPRW